MPDLYHQPYNMTVTHIKLIIYIFTEAVTQGETLQTSKSLICGDTKHTLSRLVRPVLISAARGPAAKRYHVNCIANKLALQRHRPKGLEPNVGASKRGVDSRGWAEPDMKNE